MVKPSQQIAEEIVCYAENSIAERRPSYNSLPITDREAAKAILLLEIPLTQLIEVARAAEKWSHSATRLELDQNEHDLCLAVATLKQTEKSDWL